MTSTHLFTSESVTEGHPDKLADQISDAVLDAIISVDRPGRVACETLVTTGMVRRESSAMMSPPASPPKMPNSCWTDTMSN